MQCFWTKADMPWESFQKEKVDPVILSVIKAASLVEYNAPDYRQYLENVFQGEDVPSEDIEAWAADEVKHGLVLAEWVKKADPHFDLEASLKRFHKLFRVPVDASVSIRGSKTGELVARCIVETGTSSFYTAIAEKTEEPLLKKIAFSIAADELRHYKFFYTHMKKLLQKNPISRFSRLWIALSRIKESDSHELASAYYAANISPHEEYNGKYFSKIYLQKAQSYYRFHHIQQAIRMVCKASGFSPHNKFFHFLGRLYWKFFEFQSHMCVVDEMA